MQPYNNDYAEQQEALQYAGMATDYRFIDGQWQPVAPQGFSGFSSFPVQQSTSPAQSANNAVRHIENMLKEVDAADGDANQERFKVQTKQRRDKLKNFFGDAPPIDVSLTEIQQHGLKALLQSNVPLCYFLYTLLEDFCSENLFFYLEVEQFESYPFQTKSQLLSTALHLYDTYIRDDSDFEVNIDDRVRRPIEQAIYQFDRNCFADAKKAVLKLMDASYTKFKTSAVYKRMEQEIGNTSVYTKDARNAAVVMLIKNLDKNQPEYGAAGQLTPAAMRNEMIRAMIHEFCRTRLRMDFHDRRSDNWIQAQQQLDQQQQAARAFANKSLLQHHQTRSLPNQDPSAIAYVPDQAAFAPTAVDYSAAGGLVMGAPVYNDAGFNNASGPVNKKGFMGRLVAKVTSPTSDGSESPSSATNGNNLNQLSL